MGRKAHNLMTPRKKTFRRYVVIKNCKQDFGLGPGVIARDEVTYTDERSRGFDSELFTLSQREDSVDLILQHVTVLWDSPPLRKKWNKDPQATTNASWKKRKKK